MLPNIFHNRQLAAWCIVLLSCAAISCIVFAYFKAVTGSFLPAVLPEVQSDQTYYAIQTKAVYSGHPMVGNPYYIEHVNDRFPGLIAPLWLTAIPGLFGLHINSVFAVNAVFYSMLLGGLLFTLFQRLNCDHVWLSAGIAILGVASLHNLMIRPAIMQVIYPAFALFILALYLVLEHPDRTKQYIALGTVTACTFYLYPYVWMITFTAVGLLTLHTLWNRDWQMFRRLMVMNICIAIVCIPQMRISATLFSDPLAQELIGRIGIVHTHRIHPLAILYAKYTIGIVIGLLLLRVRRRFSNRETMLLLLALALLIATFSNVITGKELHFDTHFWRTGMLITIVGIAVFAQLLRSTGIKNIIAGLCLAALLLTTVNRVAIRAGAFRYIKGPADSKAIAQNIQGFSDVFAYFSREHITGSVILASPDISMYVPLYTQNYVLFIDSARGNSMSNAEILERFVLQYINHIDAQFIENHILTYAGWQAEREASIINAYGGNTTPLERIGGQKFIDATLAQAKVESRNYDALLRKYHVRYIVIDNTSDTNPRLPSHIRVVDTTNRFTIYQIDS